MGKNRCMRVNETEGSVRQALCYNCKLVQATAELWFRNGVPQLDTELKALYVVLSFFLCLQAGHLLTKLGFCLCFVVFP